MKKTLLVLTLCIVIAAMSAVICSADEVIMESPNVKIIIDGEIGTYDDVPIIVSGRTLLPFRAILVNLGVPDDDEHIIWNPDDSSVTVVKEVNGVNKKIYLQIGNNIALINGVEEELDVAPMLYNSRTYIPARFIAQALDKKVVWDGSFNAVLIRDEKDYNEIKEILDRYDSAMLAINKYKTVGDMDIKMSIGDLGTTDMKTQFEGEVDYNNTLVHMNINMDMDLSSIQETPEALSNMDMNIEAYYTKEAYYMNMKMNLPETEDLNIPTMDQWIKISYPEGLGEMMFEKSSALSAYQNLGMNEAICAGMTIDETLSDENTIVLKGDVYLQEIFNQTLQMQNNPQLQGVTFEVNKAYMEMYIDKNTYLITKSKAIFDMGLSAEGQTIQYQIDANYEYTDYNGDFEVVLPEEINNATEMTDLTNDISE